jgi:hypothetical protein
MADRSDTREAQRSRAEIAEIALEDVRAERDRLEAERATLHEDANGVGVWVCELCGQYLGAEDAICNSGFHVGPDGLNQGKAVLTTSAMRERATLREALRYAHEWLERVDEVGRGLDGGPRTGYIGLDHPAGSYADCTICAALVSGADE